jgi:hypothetical protein
MISSVSLRLEEPWLEGPMIQGTCAIALAHKICLDTLKFGSKSSLFTSINDHSF